MAKFLFFRTDRIGDFIFSRMLVQSIKNKNKNNVIDFVCSKYNSDYIKHFTDINKIFVLDKYENANFLLIFPRFLTLSLGNVSPIT